MRLLFILVLAASPIHFDVTDGRGKKAAGVTVDAGPAESNGWFTLRVSSKGKGEPILIWPFDGRAAAPDGPEGIPVIVLDRSDSKSVGNSRVAAALEAGVLLGVSHDTGLDLKKALASATDSFSEGVRLLAEGRIADAIEPLGRALKERERQLTRVPSEIYPAAMLYGKALFAAAKYDDAAVAYLKALKQRPGDPAARKGRAEALIKAGKPEAAEQVP